MTKRQNQDVETEQDEFQNALSAYRQTLITAEQTMQSAYDKGVLTLSGGALGISLVFLKDVIGTEPLIHSSCLLAAWVVWGLSIAFVLASYFTSTMALRKAIKDTDEKTIYLTLANSCWAKSTKVLNAFGGIFFFIGIILLVAFVSSNFPR